VTLSVTAKGDASALRYWTR